MKPALLITLEYPPQVGGIAVYLSKLVDHLPVGRVQVMAPARKGTHDIDMGSSAPIYRRRLVWERFRPSWLPAWFWTGWLCRKEGNPSAIVVSHLLPMGEVAYWMKLVRRIPYVVIAHGMDAALALSSGRRKRRNAQRIMRAADLVVANSEFTARLTETFGVPKDKIVIIRPCPGFPLYKNVPGAQAEEVRQRYALDGRLTVVSVGRLVDRKGFDVCLKALASLKAQGTDLRYLVIGDGPARKKLEGLAAELGLSEAVVFAGAVPDDDLAAIYTASDIFVMTPKSAAADVEGFGIVYLEAGLFSKPVIGSKTGGVPEAVLHEKTGLLVEPDSVDQLAAAIKRLADDAGLRASLGQAGRRRVLEEFNWQKQAAIFSAALEHIAKD